MMYGLTAAEAKLAFENAGDFFLAMDTFFADKLGASGFHLCEQTNWSSIKIGA